MDTVSPYVSCMHDTSAACANTGRRLNPMTVPPPSDVMRASAGLQAVHSAPSGPRVMPCGSEPGVGRSYTSMTPSGVIEPTRLPPHSVNHRCRRRGVMACGRAVRSGSGNSVILPSGVIRPICPAPISTNQRAPSGPAVIPTGAAASVGSGWMVTVPSMPIRPIALAWFRVNHIPPSGPAVIADGNAPVAGSGNSVIWPSW